MHYGAWETTFTHMVLDKILATTSVTTIVRILRPFYQKMNSLLIFLTAVSI